MRSRGTFIAAITMVLALVLVFAGAAAAWRGPRHDERGRDGWSCDGHRDRDCGWPWGGGRDCEGPCGDDRDRRGEGPCGGVFCDGPRSPMGPWDLEALRGLDLTREQRDKFRDLLEKRRDEAAKAWETLGDLRDDLRREVLAARPDEAKVKELSRRLGEATSEAAMLAFRAGVELKGVLTPEQQARLDDARRGPAGGGARRHDRRDCR